MRTNDASDHNSMLQLMLDYRNRDATDPRDKVWAFLDIATDSDDLKVEIDYVSAWQVIYTKFTHWMCRKYRNLAFLRLVHIKAVAQNDKEAAKLPSWVPDLRAEIPLLDWMYVLFNDASHSHLRRVLDSHRIYFASANLQAQNFDKLDSPLLTVQGIKIGTIIRLSCPAGNYENNLAIGSAVEENGIWFQLARDYAASNGLYRPTNESIEEAFARLRIGDALPNEGSGRRSRTAFPQNLPKAQAVLETVEEGRRYRLTSNNLMATCVRNATTHRRLFVTDTGYMGLTHQSNKLGCEVWVLIGDDMPVILYPKPMVSPAEKRSFPMFSFRGEAYVHGAMDGEILVAKRKQQEPSLNDDGAWLDELNTEPWPFQTETIQLA